MAENNNWATATLKETAFWHDGMTSEEYEIERAYYYNNIKNVKNGTYLPLWKQKLVKN